MSGFASHSVGSPDDEIAEGEVGVCFCLEVFWSGRFLV